MKLKFYVIQLSLFFWAISISAQANTTVPGLFPGANPGKNGLNAYYYSGTNFETLVMERIDSQINFSWNASPGGAVPTDLFSVRWFGRLEAPESGEYELFVYCDDGIRLWVDGRLLIDKWFDQGSTRYGVALDLIKDRSYNIRIEFYEKRGGAVAKLYWKRPDGEHKKEEIIPSANLYPWSNM